MVFHVADVFAPSFSFDVEIGLNHEVEVEDPHQGSLLPTNKVFVKGRHVDYRFDGRDWGKFAKFGDDREH